MKSPSAASACSPAHAGELTFTPAGVDAGITFVRKLGEKVATIPAMVSNVIKRPRRTCLKNGTLHIETVEHCLAALTGLGVTNATVTLSGSTTGEIPMGDGSSEAFAEVLEDAGVIEQDRPIEPLIIRKPLQVNLGDATLAALPGPTDKLEIIYDFEAGPPVGRQVFVFHLGEDDFRKNLSPARTFVFEHEAEELKKRGFGGHLTPKDLLVLGEQGPIDNAFRFDNECVRHKVLDLIGDLTLTGRPIFGRLVAHQVRARAQSPDGAQARRARRQHLAGKPAEPRNVRDGHSADSAHPAAPVPDAAGRSGARNPGRRPCDRRQKCHE
ncbi:MAG: UDP-3-O-acyl-N-acetylglucosamine deacetylase [Tepidisphaeraceae bacterium]